MSSAEAMDVLLDQVHTALGQGDYGRLGPLTEAIEAELALLEAGDGTALLQVRAKAERNAACLHEAQRGFRAARRRVEEIKAARSGLVTYGPQGLRAEPHPSHELTKRF